MKLQFEKTTLLEEGKHEGIITRLKHEERKGFKYTNIYIQPSGAEIEIKCGVPTSLKETSQLARLLIRVCGNKFQYGEDVELEESLIGKRVSFLIQHDITEKGKFMNIIAETVKAVSPPTGVEA